MEKIENDWFEHYLGLIRAELKIPEVEELLSIRNSAKQRQDNLKKELIRIEEEVFNLESNQNQIVDEALNLEMKTSKVNEIKKIDGEIKSIELYRKKLDPKIEEVRKEVDLAEKKLGVAIKKALRKARTQEQDLLNQELEIIAKRIKEFTKAGQQAVVEIKGKVDFYFLGSKSDLDISKLIKDLQL